MRAACVVVLAASLAWAGTKEDLQEAERLLREVHEEEAVQVITRALDRPELTTDERADAYLLLGTARHNLRDEEGARLAFNKALDARRDAAAPRLASPKTRALFDEVRAAFEKSHPAVVAPPPPAVVTAPAEGWLTARRGVGLGVGAAGLAAGVVGVLLLGQAQGQYGQARSEPNALESDRLYRRAMSTNTLGGVVAAAGLAALLGGVALAVWPTQGAPVAVFVTPTSMTLAVAF